MINTDFNNQKHQRQKRYTVASAENGLVGCDNPVSPDTDVVTLNQAGIQSLPRTGEEVLHNGSDRDPVCLGVLNDDPDPDLTQDNLIIKKKELIIKDGADTISIKIVGGEVQINTTGPVRINGGTQAVARVGDSVSTSAGNGTITSGNNNLLA